MKTYLKYLTKEILIFWILFILILSVFILSDKFYYLYKFILMYKLNLKESLYILTNGLIISLSLSIPTGLFFTIIYVFNKRFYNKEITGLSIKGLNVKLLIIPVIIFMTLGYIMINQLINNTIPKANNIIKTGIQKIIKKNPYVYLKPKDFNWILNRYVLYFEDYNIEKRWAKDITIFDILNKRIKKVMQIKKAEARNGEFIIKNGYIQNIGKNMEIGKRFRLKNKVKEKGIKKKYMKYLNLSEYKRPQEYTTKELKSFVKNKSSRKYLIEIIKRQALKGAIIIFGILGIIISFNKTNYSFIFIQGLIIFIAYYWLYVFCEFNVIKRMGFNVDYRINYWLPNITILLIGIFMNLKSMIRGYRC